MKYGSPSSGFRSLTCEEIEHVTGGLTSAAETAFVAAFGYAGSVAAGLVSTGAGSEFGALLGAIACSPGGPEASSFCAAVGGVIGGRYATQIAGMSGAVAGAYVGQQAWNQLEQSGFTPTSYAPPTSDPSSLLGTGYQAPSNIQSDFASYGTAFGGGSFSGSDFGDGDFSGGGGDGGGHYQDPRFA